jgi:hypothetical protein
MAMSNTAKDGTGTDYWLVSDSNGYLKVIVQSGGGGGAQVDDAAFTPATSEITMIGGFADEASPDSVNEGDGGAVRMSLDRMLLVQASGRAAENAAAADNPLLCGGRYDSTPRTLGNADVGALALDVAGRPIVVGPVAHDAAAVGSPVRIGGVYRTSLPTGTANDILDLLLDVAGRQIVLDGGGQEVTALASAERTETTNSSDLTNPGARGVILTLDCTAITDTPSLTLSVAYKDPVGGNYEAIFSAAVAVEATGVHTYLIYPADVAASDDIVEVTKLSLPRTWRVTVTHADADAATYSVAGSYLL